ncbi:hypothetical protein OF83DRAFT_1108748 [Amylostereum chailletii]|nr:hypothetical protein OF83DRAFT_1108748 [Amylostereum chailletii]
MSPSPSTSPRPSPEPSTEPVDKASRSATPAVMEEPSSSTVDEPSSPQSNKPDEQPVASSSTPTPAPAIPGVATSGDWQAIWSPSHNAYYFYNSVTQQTTWENPIQPTASTDSAPEDSSSSPGAGPSSDPKSSAPPAVAQMYALQEAAAAQGIDPSLAYLDPSLAGPSAPGGVYNYTAKFNARTGAFTAMDGRDPSHLSEYERAKRMSQVYFDVGAWEQEVERRKAEEDAEGGKKRKRPSKKDLERFKEQKKQKKIAKTAWLRT